MKLRQVCALLLAVTMLTALFTVTASAEKTVEYDIIGLDHGYTDDVPEENRTPWSRETWNQVKYSYNEETNVHTVSRKGLNDGGLQVIYFQRDLGTYDSAWKLAYDITLVGDSVSLSVHTVNYWDAATEQQIVGDLFLNGKTEFSLAEKMAAVAGVEVIKHEQSDGSYVPYLPEGHYQGVIDISDLIPNGFSTLQHISVGFTGKKVEFREFAFVSGVEASPTRAVPTKGTAATTTAAADTADEADDAMPIGTVVAIAVGAIVLIAVTVGLLLFIKKKKA